MKQRAGVKNNLIKAWADCIDQDYCSQKINSERSLQASLWSHIYNNLPSNRRLFIEPSFTFTVSGKTKTVYPDIVICNSKEVIAVIELKYLPRGFPKYKKDIESLSLLSQHRKQLSVVNSRYRGIEKDAKEYVFSKNILFVWAGIHNQKNQLALGSFANGNQYLQGCYLQLNAVTNIGNKPDVFSL